MKFKAQIGDLKCSGTNNLICKYTTDKRTDVWSRDSMRWKINFGLWAVAWAGLWEKRVLGR